MVEQSFTVLCIDKVSWKADLARYANALPVLKVGPKRLYSILGIRYEAALHHSGKSPEDFIRINNVFLRKRGRVAIRRE
ncbi:hypothetical protein CEXT_323371 [Caerostris extrusa]|uniref:Uncharacterized protein n=1 Tax=Caerostris extrusa TaxID=172846 RepID=A0AAV4X018_CAEEX|nr:hypothetical protein CEXT_323371 [Caerostris extrusa]